MGINNGILRWPTGVNLTILMTVYADGQALPFVTPGADFTGANLIVIAMATDSPTAAPSITDSNANIYNLVRFDSQFSGTYIGTALFYCYTPVVSVAQSFNVPANTSIAIWGISGSNGTPVNGQSGSYNSFVTVINPGSVTPSIDGCFIVSVSQNFIDTNAPSTPAGLTLAIANGYNPGQYSFNISYTIQPASAPVNPTTFFIGAENFQECSLGVFS